MILNQEGEGEGEGERRGHKSLPRLPSADDAYEYGLDGYGHGYEDVGAGVWEEKDDDTPKGGTVAPLPSTESSDGSGSGSGSRSGTLDAHEGTTIEDQNVLRHVADTSSSEALNSPPPVPPSTPSIPAPTTAPALRLSALRQTFHRTEQALYAQLARTPIGNMNDARRAFYYAGLGARRRLGAWQRKHVGGGGGRGGGGAKGQARELPLGVEEPEWWGSKCHALPGGNVIVREDDWGSVIAFTLR
jgi:1-phosphatidylinositol-3-phosphate 5-kinase